MIARILSRPLGPRAAGYTVGESLLYLSVFLAAVMAMLGRA